MTRLLVPGIAADTAAPIRGDGVTRALLTLVYHSATCGGRLGENFGDLGGRTAWAGRKIVEFSGTHLQGSVCGGKCFRTVRKQLPPVNSSTSRFLQREIIFFKGYSNFLCGGPKVPLPASQPRAISADSVSGGGAGSASCWQPYAHPTNLQLRRKLRKLQDALRVNHASGVQKPTVIFYAVG